MRKGLLVYARQVFSRMTRYCLARIIKDRLDYLAACYEQGHPGILFTSVREDACHYVTYEKAVSIARQLTFLHGYTMTITPVQD